MDLFVIADYPVQLDTGSSDLWIQSPVNPNNPLPNSNQTVRLSISQLLLGANSFASLQHTISPWALLNPRACSHTDISFSSSTALAGHMAIFHILQLTLRGEFFHAGSRLH